MKTLTSIFILALVGITVWLGVLFQRPLNDFSAPKDTSKASALLSLVEGAKEVKKSNAPEISNEISKEALIAELGELIVWGPITSNTDEILKTVDELGIGSIILMGAQSRDIAETKRLTTELHSRNVLVSVDQEGGAFSRFRDIENTAQSLLKNEEEAYAVAFERGQSLKDLGVHINYAPVMEHIENPDSFLYERVFRTDKEFIDDFAVAMLEGYEDAGVIGTLKHFPGHSDTSADSHTSASLVKKSANDLSDHVRQFADTFGSFDVPVVMTAHITYPEIDSVYPATLSQKFISDILKDDLGYEGLVVTDDMNMGAITEEFSQDEALVHALGAGNDLLLYIVDSDHIERIIRNLEDLVFSEEISPAHLNNTINDIKAFKRDVYEQ